MPASRGREGRKGSESEEAEGRSEEMSERDRTGAGVFMSARAEGLRRVVGG